MKSPNILIGVNEAITAMDIKKTLESWGYHVEGKLDDLQLERDLVKVEVERIQDQIDSIKNTNIDKEALKAIFKDFKTIY
jgi:hypothetical protein